jgi:hypothetical protein
MELTMRFRRSGLGRLYSGIRSAPWSRNLTGPRGWATVAAVALVLAVTGIVAATIAADSGARAAASGPRSSRRVSAVELAVTPAAAAGATVGRSRAGQAAAIRAAAIRAAAARAAAARAAAARAAAARAAAVRAAASRAHASAAVPGELRTSCRSVAHIGDSTSVDLISPENLPDPAQQLPARYTGVGVRHLLMDASGGRSIVEALPGQVNGFNVAQAWWNQGYRGCWVLALGTNDTANVSVGSSVGLMGRINEMMSVAHGEPVLWVNTVTQLSSVPWSEANQQLWDSTLVSALTRYPNMRVLNWAALAQPGWFLPDGIHYNAIGCAARAQAIADGLARAFPRYGHSQGQIVG